MKRRRRENKTNYSTRLKMLSGNKPRLVYRRTNQYITAQYVTSVAAQDTIQFQISSKDLIGAGWPKEMAGSLKSVPAAYLVGYMAGKKIIKDKIETPIADFGMIRMIYKTKTYSFLKGLIDAGVKINCKDNAFPEEARIKGASMKEDFTKTFETIKSNIDKQ